MINGKAPYLGAELYDIQHGFGTVAQVEPDMSFVLDFKGGRTARYSSGGFVGNARRVYWNNPIIVEPEDDKDIWTTFITIVRPIYALLRTVVQKYNRG